MNITSHGISLKKASPRKLACSVMGTYGLFLLVIIISLAQVFLYRFSDNNLFYFVATALFLIILLFLTVSVLPFSSKEQHEDRLNLSNLSGFIMVGFSLLVTIFFLLKESLYSVLVLSSHTYHFSRVNSLLYLGFASKCFISVPFRIIVLYSANLDCSHGCERGQHASPLRSGFS